MKKILYTAAILLLISNTARADNYAVIDQNGDVVNVINYDGVTPYTPPAGTTIVKDPNTPPKVGIGWEYEDGEFFNPNDGG